MFNIKNTCNFLGPIGHIFHFLDFSAFRKGHAVEIIHEMSKKYGGIFSIYLGMFSFFHFLFNVSNDLSIT